MEDYMIPIYASTTSAVIEKKTKQTKVEIYEGVIKDLKKKLEHPHGQMVLTFSDNI